MRNFFDRYSYSAVKMFIYQFAIGLLGAVLSLATSQNMTLSIISGVVSVLFYAPEWLLSHLTADFINTTGIYTVDCVVEVNALSEIGEEQLTFSVSLDEYSLAWDKLEE